MFHNKPTRGRAAVDHSRLQTIFPLSSRLSRIAVCTALALTSSLLSAPCATAQEASSVDTVNDADDAVELEETYVRPDYVEIERLRQTKEIIVIPQEEIRDRGNRTISDVLGQVPGVTVGTTSFGEIDIRGQGVGQASRNIQVMIDGAPITTLVNHPATTNYDVVPVEEIERIEVIPGGGSVLYGSGASGGVVNITTNLRSMKDPKNTATIEANTDGFRANAKIGGKALDDRLKFTATASKLNRDLWFDNTYRNSEYYSAGALFDFTPKQSVALRVSHLKEDSQFINQASLADIKKYGKDYVPIIEETVGIDMTTFQPIKEKRTAYLDGDREMTTVNGTYANNISDWLHFTGDFFYTEGNYSNIDAGQNQRVDHDGYGTKLKLDVNYWDTSNLLIGFDYSRQSADLDYDGKDLAGIGSDGYYIWNIIPYNFNYDRTIAALFVLNNYRVGQFEFTQGIRRESTQWDFNKVGQNISGAEERNSWNTAFELSAAWLYRDTGRVYLRYERGYTTPDGLQISDQVYHGSKRVYQKTDAEDETFDLFELGWRDRIFGSTVSLTLWYSETDNQMDRLSIINGFRLETRTYNMYDTKRYGLDLALSQRFGRLSLEESYSYLHGETDYNEKGRQLVASGRPFTTDGLQAVPGHQARISATFDFTDNLSGTLTWQYKGSYNNFQKEADEANGVMKAHSTFDLSARYRINKHLEMFGGVTNLTDEEYYEYVMPSSTRYITPGRERTFFVG